MNLPKIEDDDTTIDGTAYDSANGTTVRDDDTANLGTGGTVGVDGLVLLTLDPELEIVADSSARKIGLEIKADDATIRGLSS